MKNLEFYELLLFIPVSDHIYSDAEKIKEQFKQDYGCNDTVISKPHISISNIVQPQYMEKKLIGIYNRLSSETFTPFEIIFSGFKYFKHVRGASSPTYTIYIQVINNSVFSEISKLIKSSVNAKSFGKKKFKPYYPEEPHLTIAKKISQQQFNECWPVWKEKKFTSSFIADGMQLLKRKIDNIPRKYEAVQCFSFTGDGNLNTQLEFF